MEDAKWATRTLEKGASKQELKEFFAGGGQTAITIRIPANLRDAFKEEAELHGMKKRPAWFIPASAGERALKR